MNRTFPVLLFIFSAAAVQPVCAQDFESLSRIRDLAQTFALEKAEETLQGRIEVDTVALDSRLKLRTCESDPEVFLPYGFQQNGKLSVGVRCTNGPSWKIFVGVNLRVYQPVIVTTRALRRNETLGDDAVQILEQDVTKMTSGYYQDHADIDGMVPKRALRAGTPLGPAHLTYPRIVQRGDSVTIVAKQGALTVRSAGIAQKDGKKNDRIPVRNAKSNRTIDARVVGPNTVEVTL